MGILTDIAKIAIGTAIGNSSIARENRKQTQLMKEQEERERRREYEIRHRESVESQRQWDAVRKANIERRKKGQPELPLPPRSWY